MNLRSLAIVAVLCASVLPAQDEVPVEILDRLVSRFEEDGQPGGVAAVMREGELVWSRPFGCRDIGTEPRVPNSAETRFYIGSTSKQFTAACALLLVLDGSLELDDPVAKHVPELGELADGMTVRHLLLHRSGLRDFYELGMLGGIELEDFDGLDKVLALAVRQRGLSFPPGRDYQYSNTGYALLAVIVERVAGAPMSTFAQQRMFEPLGMDATVFRDDPDLVVEDSAVGHETVDGELARSQLRRFAIVGPGGLWTNVVDLARWADELDTGAVLGEEFRAVMRSVPELPAHAWLDPRVGDYGYGQMFDTLDGWDVVHHAGGLGGYRAQLLRIPELRLAVAVLANRTGIDVGLLSRRLADAVVDPKPGFTDAVVEAAATEPVELTNVRLMFIDDVTGDPFGFEIRDGAVQIESIAGALRFRPIAVDRFRSIRTAVPVELELAKTASGDFVLTIQPEGRTARSFRSRPFGGGSTDGLTGAWRCDEVDATLEIVDRDGRLALAGEPFAPLSSFVPMSADVWVSPGRPILTLSVERDDDGAAIRLRLSTPRARGLVLIRPD